MQIVTEATVLINMSGIWIGLGISAASAAYGAYSTNKGQKASKKNQQAFNLATIKNEEEARKLFDGFIKQYNESAEKLEEGMTIEEYMGRMVKVLNNPQLEEAYRKSRRGDWAMAQEFADQANEQNLSAFDLAVERISGGDYDKMLETRNKTILGESWEDLYKESTRVRAPRQIAGSVARGGEGEAVEGQRADKFEFQQSITDQRKQNEITFARSRTAIEDDRVAAQRQQQRASEFLPMLNYSDFASQNVVQPFNAQSLQAQLAKLQLEAGLASNAMGAAFGAPQPPPAIDTSASQALTQQGTQQAIAALASMYKTNQQTSGGSGSYLYGNNSGGSNFRSGATDTPASITRYG